MVTFVRPRKIVPGMLFRHNFDLAVYIFKQVVDGDICSFTAYRRATKIGRSTPICQPMEYLYNIHGMIYLGDLWQVNLQ